MPLQKLSSDTKRFVVAYGIVIALAVIPSAVLALLQDHYTLPPPGNGRPPFVVIASLIGFVLAMLRPLFLVFKRHPHPTRQIIDDIRQYWPWLLSIALMLLALPESLDAATRFKKIIPQIQPFYLDPALAAFDRRLFGVDAWQVTHSVIGADLTRILDTVYGLWHLVNIGLLCWICLTPDRRFQLQAGICYQLAWLLMGAGLAIAFSSVGPCFYDHFYGGEEFRPLLDRLTEIGGTDELKTMFSMKYLLASVGKDAIGGGISAMPSMHVGISTLVILVAHDRFRKHWWPTALACLYTFVMYVGSIHLGWHYATDGVVSAIVMVLIWFAVKFGLRALLPPQVNPGPGPTRDHK